MIKASGVDMWRDRAWPTGKGPSCSESPTSPGSKWPRWAREALRDTELAMRKGALAGGNHPELTGQTGCSRRGLGTGRGRASARRSSQPASLARGGGWSLVVHCKVLLHCLDRRYLESGTVPQLEPGTPCLAQVHLQSAPPKPDGSGRLPGALLIVVMLNLRLKIEAEIAPNSISFVAGFASEEISHSNASVPDASLETPSCLRQCRYRGASKPGCGAQKIAQTFKARMPLPEEPAHQKQTKTRVIQLRTCILLFLHSSLTSSSLSVARRH